MNHSPANILTQFLIDEEIVVEDQSEEWFVTVGKMPDEGDKAVCVYNTTGVPDGRYQKTGERVEHPAVQIRIRDLTDPDCWIKAWEITDALDALKNVEVELDEDTYLIENVTRPSPIIPLGPEAGRRRFLYTINALLTIGVVT